MPGRWSPPLGGFTWAGSILEATAAELSSAIAGLQAFVDPDCIVVGGGVGLSDGFLDLVRDKLRDYPSVIVPHLVRPALGVDAGIIGAADLVRLPDR